MAVSGRNPCHTPYSLPETKDPSPYQLLSLEGWIGWSGEGDSNARLHIPTQTLWPGQPALQVPLTDLHIEAIEEARKGGAAQFYITLTGQATATAQLTPPANAQPARNTAAPAVEQVVMGIVPVQCTSSTTFVIERERWLIILQQLGAGTYQEHPLTQGDILRFGDTELRFECS